MYYPQTRWAGLLWLLCGLFGGGTWPALRQAVKTVDYEVFNLVFIPSMSVCGIALLWLLSLPAARGPPPRPFGPGEWSGLLAAVTYETEHKAPLWLATLSGACVSASNFMLAAALPRAGLTRGLPCFSGVAILVGVGASYTLEGNARPLSLCVGVALILAAVLLTFNSRGDDGRETMGGLARSRGLLSAPNLQELVHQRAPSEPSLLNLAGVPSSPWWALPSRSDSGPLRLNTSRSRKNRALAVIVCAGAVDGLWSSLTCAAKLNHIDNYVTAFYFCLGLLAPLAVFEMVIFARDPEAFARKLRNQLSPARVAVAFSCGFLNVWGIITYFMATVRVPAAVAFAIFLSTPLVSITLGAACFGELQNQSAAQRSTVVAILCLYVAAVLCLAFNALAPAPPVPIGLPPGVVPAKP